MKPTQTAMRGVTLMELMVVIAIVGILASIAYPSYRNYVIRANRADAQQVLMQAAQDAERYYAANNSYTDYAVSAGLDSSPQEGTAIYNIAVEGDVEANRFTLRATPVDTAANKDDGFLEVTSAGAKRWDRNNDGDTGDAEETNWTR